MKRSPQSSLNNGKKTSDAHFTGVSEVYQALQKNLSGSLLTLYERYYNSNSSRSFGI